jgi:hypothetical protein
VRPTFSALAYIEIPYQRCEKSPWMAMGVLGYDDLLGFLYDFSGLSVAGDACACSSAEEGELNYLVY